MRTSLNSVRAPLPRLLALTSYGPLLSHQTVADLVGLSVAGASNLLERVDSAELLIEITQRWSWRLFLAPDLGIEFGDIRPSRGRPRAETPYCTVTRSRCHVRDLDAEMARIDRLLSDTSTRGT